MFCFIMKQKKAEQNNRYFVDSEELNYKQFFFRYYIIKDVGDRGLLHSSVSGCFQQFC